MLTEVSTELLPVLAPRLSLGLASCSDEVDEAQRLRHRIFVDEMGANSTMDCSGRERDFFDAWCEHLIVRDLATGDVVGTCRMLVAESARRLGTFCAEREFDLTRLVRLRPHLMEVGRVCVDPAYRTGATSMLFWSSLAAFARERSASYVICCASMSMADDGAHALAMYEYLATRHLAPPEYRVVPRSPLAPRGSPVGPACSMPPLFNEYLRLGAWIGGAPAWDPDFNIADLLVLLPLRRVEERCARHSLGEQVRAA